MTEDYESAHINKNFNLNVVTLIFKNLKCVHINKSSLYIGIVLYVYTYVFALVFVLLLFQM